MRSTSTNALLINCEVEMPSLSPTSSSSGISANSSSNSGDRRENEDRSAGARPVLSHDSGPQRPKPGGERANRALKATSISSESDGESHISSSGKDEFPRPNSKKGNPSLMIEDNFDSWYLRLVTKQFSADLDKLREAPDFKDASVPVLIEALKQGSTLFGEDEKWVAMKQAG